MGSPVTTRALGFLSGGLGLALIGSSIFGYVQTERLSAARETIQAREATIATHKAAVVDRDVLIAKQNDAVRQLQAKSEEDRAAYLERLAAADKRAEVYKGQAKSLLTATTEATDELGAAALPSS
ncbi:hypothetical protein [Novosphingobium panipatense]|uniref:hypothetical protein n=1 Tax=Novosphingobium panipatense TaxID=428991 RepID=UPI00361B4498